jgi:hypothetical protein
MGTVPSARASEPSEMHPAWCQQGHDGLAMHRGPTVMVRDRDGIRMDAYLVAYDDSPQLSLDITAEVDTSLIELSVAEANCLRTCLIRLLGEADLLGADISLHDGTSPRERQPLTAATADLCERVDRRVVGLREAV